MLSLAATWQNSRRGDGLRTVKIGGNKTQLSSLGDGVLAPVGAGSVRSLEIAVADKQELERGSPGQGVVGRIGGGGGAVDDAVIVKVDDILAEPGGSLDVGKRIHQDAALRRGILLGR